MRAARQSKRVDYAAMDRGNVDDSDLEEDKPSSKRAPGNQSRSRAAKAAVSNSKANGSNTAGGAAGATSTKSAADAQSSGPARPPWSEKYDRLLGRVKGQLSRLKTADVFIDLYEGSGWKGASADKIKPEGELIAASATIIDAKRKMRAILAEVWGQDPHHDKYSQLAQAAASATEAAGSSSPGSSAAAVPATSAPAPKGAAAMSRHAAAVSQGLAGLVGSAGAISSGAMVDEDGDSIDAEDIACSACGVGESTDDNDILLCDYAGCGRCYHMACCDPPLKAEMLPPEHQDWVCARCACVVACICEINDQLSTDFNAIVDVFRDVDGEDRRLQARRAAYEAKRQAQTAPRAAAAGAGAPAGAQEEGAEPVPLAMRRVPRAAAIAARHSEEWQALAQEPEQEAEAGPGAGASSSVQAGSSAAPRDEGEDDDEDDEHDASDGSSAPYDEAADEDFQGGDDDFQGGDDDEDDDEDEEGVDGGSDGEGGDEELGGEEAQEDVDEELAALRAEAAELGLDLGQDGSAGHADGHGHQGRRLRRKGPVDYTALAEKIFGEAQQDDDEDGEQGAAAGASSSPAAPANGRKRKRPAPSGGVLADLMRRAEAGEDEEEQQEEVDPEHLAGRQALANLLGGNGLADEDDEDWGPAAARKRARKPKAPAGQAAAAAAPQEAVASSSSSAAEPAGPSEGQGPVAT